MPDPAPAPSPAPAPNPGPAPSFLGGGNPNPAPNPNPSPNPAPQPNPSPNPNPNPAPQPSGYTSPFASGLNPDGTYREGWTQQLADQGLTRLANRMMTFKNEGDALRSLDHALGLIGKRPEVGPPKAGATPQDVQAYRDAVGIPAEPTGYELEKLMPEGHKATEDLTDFAKIMHEHHVPKEVAEKLATKYAGMAQKQAEASSTEFETQLGTKFQEADEIFKKEWGDEHAGRLQANKDYVSTLGLDMSDPMTRAALSMPWVIRALDTSRRSLRGQLPGADGKEVVTGSQSARQQAQEIIRQNPNYRKNPDLVRQVNQLYALDAAASKRK